MPGAGIEPARAGEGAADFKTSPTTTRQHGAQRNALIWRDFFVVRCGRVLVDGVGLWRELRTNYTRDAILAPSPG